MSAALAAPTGGDRGRPNTQQRNGYLTNGFRAAGSDSITGHCSRIFDATCIEMGGPDTLRQRDGW